MTDDNLHVTLVVTFWHPRFGVVMWHTNELDELFVMGCPDVKEQDAQRVSDGYIELLSPATIGERDVSIN